MKRLAYRTFFIGLVVIVTACAGAAPQPTGDRVKPGDKIGEFLITTGTEGDVTYGWQLDQCVHQDDKQLNLCPVPVGTKVNVSVGVYDDTFNGRLDTLWSGHTYQMLIEDHPVDLQAFGFTDITHPMVGKIRYWDVVILATQPGDITVSSKGIVGGDPLEDTTTYSFSAQ